MKLHWQVLEMEVALAGEQITEEVLHDRYSSKLWMVLGEGAVFMIFLFFGMWKLRQYLNRERKLVQLQNNFMLSITHELKSPIASILLNLETMKKRDLDRHRQHQIIDNSLEEGERLNHLTENILLASRIERGKDLFHFDKVDLSHLTQKVFDAVAHFDGDRHRCEIEVEEGVFIHADAFAIEVLLRNLIENALKYTPESGGVIVKLQEKNDEIHLMVEDEGEGIPDNEKKEVFKKFYRIGSEEVRKHKGTGLGLFLVKEIASLHGARVEVSDVTPSGTHFLVAFKKV